MKKILLNMGLSLGLMSLGHAATLDAFYGFSNLNVSQSGTIALVGGSSQYPVELYPGLDTATGTLSSVAYLSPSDSISQYFGSSVSLSGAIGLVGGYDDYQGAAYLYRNLNTTTTGGRYQDVKLTNSNGGEGDYFGAAVSLSGSIGLVGAPWNNKGAAYVYRGLDTATGTVTENASLISSEGANGEQFGSVVSVSGTIGLVGAYAKNDSRGAVYVYRNLDTATGTVMEDAKLHGSHDAAGGEFGISMSQSGTSVLVGAPRNNASLGDAYLFRNLDTISGTVDEDVRLTASDLLTSEDFGASVSLSGSNGLVGAPSKNSSQGAVYLYRGLDSATGVVQENVKLTASSGATGAAFGNSLSLSGDLFIIGTMNGDKAYTGSVSSMTTLDAGSTSRNIDGISFVSREDWIIGKSTSSNQVTLKSGNTGNVTASGKAVYIGKDAGSNNNTLVVEGGLNATQIYIGAAGNTGNVLQIGTGGTTDTISSNSVIANNGSFIINQANTLTLGGVITGNGSLTQAGSGTTILNAANTYTGGTMISAGTLQLGNGSTTGSLSTSSAIVNNGNFAINRSNTVTQGTDFSAAAITGNGSFTQAGSGTTLLNAANSYAGDTIINAGTLRAGVANAIPSGTGKGNVVIDGQSSNAGIFDLNGFDVSINGLSGTSNTSLGTVVNNATGTNKKLTLGNNDASATFAGQIVNNTSGTGTLALEKVGNGTQILSGANTYTGGTTITGGTLQLGSGSTTGSLSTSSAIVNNGNFAINRSNTVTQGTDFSGAAITGNGSLTQAGSGTTILTASNTYTGNTTITGGTLQLGNGSTTGSLSTSSAIVNNGNFAINRSNTVTQGTDFSAAAINGIGSFTQAGAGNTTLNAANSYAGNTIINSGTLQAGVANAIPSGAGKGNVVINGQSSSAGIFDLNGFDVSINGLSGTSNTSLGRVVNNATSTNKKLTLGNNNASATFAGQIVNNTSGNGTLALEKVGSGTQTLTGTNSYTGGTTITGGTLQLGNGSTTGSLSTSSTILNNGNFTINRSNAVTQGTDFSTAAITGNGSFTQAGAGNTTLNAANSYAGDTIINAGTLRAGATNPIPSGAGKGNVVINGRSSNAGILDLNGFDVSINGLSGTSNTSLGRVVNNATGTNKKLTLGNNDASATFAGQILNNTSGTGTLALEKVGNGTQILSGTNTYTGGTTITGGTLQLGSGSTTGNLPTSSAIVNNGNFAINRSNTVTQGTNFSSAAITGNGSFTQAGLGTTILNAANSYAGNTIINAGTLRAGASNAIPSGTGKGNVVINGQSSNAGIFDLNGFDVSINGLSGTSNTSLGRVVNNATGTNKKLTLGNNDASATFAGQIVNNTSGTGTLALEKVGNGTQILSGTNTYTGGTTISGGTLQLGNGSTTGALSSTGAIVNNGNFTINRSNTVTQGTDFSGAAITGNGSFTQAGTGTTLLNAANTYSGGTSVQAGTLRAGNTSAFGSGAVAVSGGSLDLNGYTIGNTLNVSGGSLTGLQNYTGTQAISGTAAYSGTVASNLNVTSGGKVNTTGATFTGAINVGSGGTLGGSGTVNSIAGAGTVGPGNSPGILTAQTLDLSGGADFKFELTTATPTYSDAFASGNDVLHLTDGTAPITGTATNANVFDIYLNVTTLTSGDFLGGIFTDKSSDFSALVLGGTYNYYVKGDGLGTNVYNSVNYYTLGQYNIATFSTWSITASVAPVASANFAGGTVTGGFEQKFTAAVPEPSTYAMLLLGMVVVGIMARRRRVAGL